MSSNRLSVFSAEKRRLIFDSLRQGKPPQEGVYEEAVFKEGKAKGEPQMGTTRYEPDSILFEFIYPDAQSAATVLVVKVQAPERILFLPVPEWVLESIWQGEISGSYHFESDANALVEAFRAELSTENNRKWFQPQAAKRRE